MVATDTPVDMAKTAIDQLTQEQRVALTIEIIRDIGSPSCIAQLTRLQVVTDLTLTSLKAMGDLAQGGDFDPAFTKTFFEFFHGKAEQDFDAAFKMAITHLCGTQQACVIPSKSQWAHEIPQQKSAS